MEIAKARQALCDKVFQRTERLRASNRPTKFFQCSEVVAKALLDQRHHLTRYGIGLKSETRRQGDPWRQTLTVRLIAIPFATRGALPLHEHLMFAAHFPVEMLHAPGAASARPFRKAVSACKETSIGPYLDGAAGQRCPAFDRLLNTPFPWFTHHDTFG